MGNVSIGMVYTILRWYAETDSFVEHPYQSGPQKMSQREDGLTEVLSKYYGFKITHISAGINEN